MAMDAFSQVVIVGLGRLGGTLRAALAARCAVREIFARALIAGEPTEPIDADALVLLTTRDDSIAAAAQALASGGALAASPVVLHCSGALGGDILSAAAEVGCTTGSLHPLQTFPTVEAGLDALANAPWFFEGDAPAQAPAEALVELLGGRFSILPPGSKSLYHAAAVLSCNYMTVLLDAADRLYGACGMPPADARAAMAPILETTLRNTLARGGAALTGPISRGDAATVQQHLDALAPTPDLERLYREMGLACAALAERNAQIDPPTRQSLDHLLERESQ